MPEEIYAVVVSGSRWNPYGHVLLNTGGVGGHYFHVASVRGFPKCLDEAGFQSYLSASQKQIVRRIKVPLPDPDNAYRRLQILMGQKWTWFVLEANCARFVEEVLWAGGVPILLEMNRPIPNFARGIIRLLVFSSVGFISSALLLFSAASYWFSGGLGLGFYVILFVVALIGAAAGFVYACIGQAFW